MEPTTTRPDAASSMSSQSSQSSRSSQSSQSSMSSRSSQSSQSSMSSRSSRSSTGPSRRSPETTIWWNLANVIDVVHFPIVVALVLLGAVYFSGPVFVVLLTLMVALQVATLGCPVMWLTGQLRKVHDPDYQVRWSFTAWLYERYGRWVGIAVFCALGAATLVLRAWLF